MHVSVLLLRRQQLDADPQQQGGTDQLQVRHLQQRQGERNQHDAQHDCAGRSPQNALGAQMRRQLAAGQSDHHGIVATQQDVDHDDLTNCYPELGG